MTSWAFAAPFRLSLAGTVGLAADFEAVAGSGSLTVGAQIATLSVTSESGSGARPYAATVLPLRGVVPSGSHVTNAAGTEAGAILSTHDDDSAAVVVFASTASATGTVPLHVATGTAPAALTAAAIAAAGLTSVAVAFGSPYGTASLTDFGTPERIWWATSKTICARYRVAAPTPGGTALEAVIDIHAWSDRALVEVVVENCKMTTATPSAPAAATYTGATVSINGGAAIATVNSADMPTELAHSPFRSWYASGWAGTNPGLRVTQLHSELQLHPLLFKCDQTATFDMSDYAADAYTPWTTGRQRATNMGGVGDSATIGPLPQWEARALQSGDYRAWRATEVSALAVLGYNINYRDTTTGLVPTFTELAGKTLQSNFPSQGNGSDAMTWEIAHHPAAGLMAFISRPSPVFIELAQKVAAWNGIWSTDDLSNPDVAAGVFGAVHQTRGRAWGVRSLAHAIFMTPDALAWKAAGKTALQGCVTWMDNFRTDSKAVLNIMWTNRWDNPIEEYGVSVDDRVNTAGWQHHYLITELHKAASARLLTGSAQTAIETLADWVALQPVRWINEQANGGWRYVPYATPLGRAGEAAPTLNSYSDWGTQRADYMTGSPSSVSGTWFGINAQSHSAYTDGVADTAGGVSYPVYFWSALVAAVERGVAGAATAWQTVLSNITGIDTWRAGFGSDPRWGSVPKNPPGFATGAGTGSIAGQVWTPARTGELVNLASWDSVPTGDWYEVSGTRIDALTITSPGWTSGNLGWAGVMNAWNGFAVDTAGSRLWLAAAGGHSDSANNGVYEFNAYKMAWSVRRQPSDRSVWSSMYSSLTAPQPGTYTECYESRALTPYAAMGEQTYPVAYHFDTLAWDMRPTSRHVYQSTVYSASRNELISGVRQMWRFSLDTNDWVFGRRWDDRDEPDGSDVRGIWDEVTGEYLFSGSSGTGYARIYNPAANTFSAWVPPWRSSPAFQTRYGRTVSLIKGITTSYVFGSGSEGQFWRYDLDSRTADRDEQVQLGGGLTAADFLSPGSNQGGWSFEYIPPLGKYWVLANMAAGRRWLQLDPATTPATLSPLTFTNPPAANTLPSGKVVYMPELDAVLMATYADRGFFVYKF